MNHAEIMHWSMTKKLEAVRDRIYAEAKRERKAATMFDESGVAKSGRLARGIAQGLDRAAAIIVELLNK